MLIWYFGGDARSILSGVSENIQARFREFKRFLTDAFEGSIIAALGVKERFCGISEQGARTSPDCRSVLFRCRVVLAVRNGEKANYAFAPFVIYRPSRMDLRLVVLDPILFSVVGAPVCWQGLPLHCSLTT